MKRVEQFPDPGSNPGTPGAEPPYTSPERKQWFEANLAFRTWIEKKRRHMVAEAIDEIEERGDFGTLPPETQIIMVLGAAFLDGVGQKEKLLGIF